MSSTDANPRGLRFRVKPALALLAGVLGLGACKNSTPAQVRPSVTITKPTNGQQIGLADDQDPSTPGIQYSVLASVTNISNGSTATLLFDGTPVPGFSQTISTTNNSANLTFNQPTIPSGAHAISVEVADKASGVTVAATVSVSVVSTTSCQFVVPTNGATIGPSGDVEPNVPGMQIDVQVVCPSLAQGVPVSLSVAAPSGLGGIVEPAITATYGAGMASFTNVNVSEGVNILLFQVNSADGGVADTAQNTITVDTGGCGVWLGNTPNAVYNEFGQPPPSGTWAVVADTDPDAGGIQGTFTAYADITRCPAGSTATLSFDNQPVATSQVGSTGMIQFAGVTIPDGDPVVEVVTVAAPSGSPTGTSLPNDYHVDSVVPAIVITSPTGTLGPPAPASPGVQAALGVTETGIDSATLVSALDGTAIIIPPATLTTIPDGGGSIVFSPDLTLASGIHALSVAAQRKYGNIGTSPSDEVTVLYSDGGVPDAGSPDGGSSDGGTSSTSSGGSTSKAASTGTGSTLASTSTGSPSTSTGSAPSTSGASSTSSGTRSTGSPGSSSTGLLTVSSGTSTGASKSSSATNSSVGGSTSSAKTSTATTTGKSSSTGVASTSKTTGTLSTSSGATTSSSTGTSVTGSSTANTGSSVTTATNSTGTSATSSTGTSVTSSTGSSVASSTGTLGTSSTGSSVTSSASSGTTGSGSSGTVSTTGTVATSSSGTTGTSGAVDGGVVINAPSGTININDSLTGDYATYTVVSAELTLSNTPVSGETTIVCSTVALSIDGGAAASPCPDTSGYWLMPGSSQPATGTGVFFNLNLPEGPQQLIAEELAADSSLVAFSAASPVDVETVPPQVLTVTVPGESGGVLNEVAAPIGSPISVDATFQGVADGLVATLNDGKTQVAQGVVESGSTTFSVSTLSDGNHTLQVLVSDAFGNPNEGPGATPPYSNPADTLTVNVERTPPAISVQAPASGFICNQASTLDSSHQTCEVTFTVNVGNSATQVTFSGAGTVNGSASVTPTNNSASATYSNVPQGASETLVATAEDQYGNTAQVTVSFPVDTVPPTITSVVAPDAGALYTSQSLPFDIVTSGATGGQITVTSSAQGTPIDTVPVDASGETVFNATVPNGSQTITITATDAAGNTSAPFTVNVVVAVACQLSFSFPASSHVTFNASNLNGDGTVTLTGSTSCVGTTIDFTKTLSGGSPVDEGTASSNVLTGAFTFNMPFSDGEIGTVITATDTFSGDSVNFTASTKFTPPGLTISAPAANGSDQLFIVANQNNINAGVVPGYVANPTGASNGQVDFEMVVTGASGGTIQIQEQGASSPEFSSSITSNSETFSTHPPYPDGGQGTGSYVGLDQGFQGPLTVTVTDSAGNVTSQVYQLTVDVIAPVVPAATLSVVNARTATLGFTLNPATDNGVDGGAIAWDLQYTTSALLGAQGSPTQSEFFASGVPVYVDAGLVGTSPTSVQLSPVPPFNTYYVAPLAIDSVGNVSSFIPQSLDDNLTQTTVTFEQTGLDNGANSSAAGFGFQIAVADIDGDGFADIAVASLATPDAGGSGTISILYGDANYQFSRIQNFAPPAATLYAFGGTTLGDITGDGRPDLITSELGQLDIYLFPTGGGPGTNLPATPSTTITGDPMGLLISTAVVPDITGDGIPDLVACDPYGGPAGTGIVYVFHGRASWPPTMDVSLADFTIEATSTSSFLGGVKGMTGITDGTGTVKNVLFIGDTGLQAGYLFDATTLNPPDGGFTVADGGPFTVAQADQTFGPVSTNESFGTAAVGIDVNGDGLEDLVVSDNESYLYAFTQIASANPINAFTTNTSPFYNRGAGLQFGASLAVGDLNGDGFPDLVVGDDPKLNGRVTLFFSQPGGALSNSPGAVVFGGTVAGEDVGVGAVGGASAGNSLIFGVPGVGNGNIVVVHP